MSNIEPIVEAKTLYKEILYLIYKKLFLFVIEERKLVFTEEFIKENKEKVDIYYNWYSLARIRILAEKNRFYNKKHFDLWQGIIKTFQLFEKEEFGKALGVKPLSGTLFSGDFVAFFFRRAYDIINNGRFLSFISTNTISQGTTREIALDQIYNNNGVVNFAIRSKKWPGKANVSVSLLSIYKGNWRNKYLLDNKKVNFINPYLTDDKIYGNPNRLKANENKSFQGSIILGLGFTMPKNDATKIINGRGEAVPHPPINYKDVLFPYLNGADLNRDPLQRPSRWVINFFDWNEKKCKDNYPVCYDIVEEKVKPERMIIKDKEGKKFWWRHLRIRPKLYSTIKGMERVLVVSRVTKQVILSFQKTNMVYSEATIVFTLDKYHQFAILQSTLHNEWAWNYCSRMGDSSLRYTPTSAFQTFPFPDTSPLNPPKGGLEKVQVEQTTPADNNFPSHAELDSVRGFEGPSWEASLETIGEKYYNLRQELTTGLWLGLTKLYNLFHKRDLSVDNIKILDATEHTPSDTGLTPRSSGELSYGEYYFEKIIELRKLHKEMDELVLSAYGWSDIDLSHDFYEVDYLPENDRVRYTISPKARKEVLKRLLELNFERKKEEELILLSESKANKKVKKDKSIGKSLF